MTRVPDEVVSRFLDGELPAGEERATLHRIADDPEARSLLRFDARLRGALAGDVGGGGSVPAGFTDRVMAAIEAREPAGAASTESVRADDDEPGRLAAAWEAFTRPRTLVWRPAHAAGALGAAAVAAVLALGPLSDGIGPFGDGARAGGGAAAGADPADRSLATAGRTAATAAETDRVLVRFVFADGEAESVAVAGDFTRWEPIPLTRRESSGRVVWSGMVAVPRGEHRYMFVLDGDRWITDPLATAVRDDGFGNRNALLSL